MGVGVVRGEARRGGRRMRLYARTMNKAWTMVLDQARVESWEQSPVCLSCLPLLPALPVCCLRLPAVLALPCLAVCRLSCQGPPREAMHLPSPPCGAKLPSQAHTDGQADDGRAAPRQAMLGLGWACPTAYLLAYRLTGLTAPPMPFSHDCPNLNASLPIAQPINSLHSSCRGRVKLHACGLLTLGSHEKSLAVPRVPRSPSFPRYQTKEQPFEASGQEKEEDWSNVFSRRRRRGQGEKRLDRPLV